MKPDGLDWEQERQWRKSEEDSRRAIEDAEYEAKRQLDEEARRHRQEAQRRQAAYSEEIEILSADRESASQGLRDLACLVHDAGLTMKELQAAAARKATIRVEWL